MTDQDPQPRASDDTLMRGAGEGDRQALEELVRRHLDWTWQLAYRVTRDPHDARDLVQETWVRLIERADRYQPRGRFRPYLKVMLTRLWVDRLRRWGPEPRGELPEPEGGRGPDQAAATRAGEVEIWGAVARLPASQRQALTLRVRAEASYEQIAEALGTSRKGAEMLLQRARRALLPVLGRGAREEN